MTTTPEVLVDPASPPAPPPPPLVTTAATPPDPPRGPLAAVLAFLTRLKGVTGWKKWALFVPFVVVGAFYYRDKRVGDGFFADPPAWSVQLFEGAKATARPDGSVVVTYPDGTVAPAHGLAVTAWTADNDREMPDRLAGFKDIVSRDDLPVLLWMNATGFDPTGDPVAVTRVRDGKVLYANPQAVARPRMVVVEPDGTFTAHPASGGPVKLSEAEWVRRYMRLPTRPDPVHAPAEFEKLTDAELKAKGFERVTADEYEKRFGRKPPVARSVTLPPDVKEK